MITLIIGSCHGVFVDWKQDCQSVSAAIRMEYLSGCVDCSPLTKRCFVVCQQISWHSDFILFFAGANRIHFVCYIAAGECFFLDFLLSAAAFRQKAQAHQRKYLIAFDGKLEMTLTRFSS